MKLKLYKTTIQGAKTLKCNQCNKMFRYKKVLTEHIDNVHRIKDGSWRKKIINVLFVTMHFLQCYK